MSRIARFLGFHAMDSNTGSGSTLRRGDLEGALRGYFDTQRVPLKEQQMLTNIVRFGEMTAEDIMIHRPDIVALDEGSSLEEIKQVFLSKPYSRLPVYRGTLDNPVGVLHVKDLLLAILLESTGEKSLGENGDGRDWAYQKEDEEKLKRSVLSLARCRVLFVPPSMLALELLVRMKTSRTHTALVIDEYGGTEGLITPTDLVREIVDGMSDNGDNGDPNVLLRHPDGSLEVSAKMDLEDLSRELSVSFFGEEKDESSEQIGTIGGFIVSLVGRVPSPGEKISPDRLPGLGFEILDADPRRIKRVLIRRA